MHIQLPANVMSLKSSHPDGKGDGRFIVTCVIEAGGEAK